MSPAQIAAEVSARYGVPVDPAVVRFIPQGVQAMPFDQVYSLRAQIHAAFEKGKAKNRGGTAPKPDIARLPGESDDAYMVRAKAEGAALRTIGEKLGISAPAVMSRLRKLA